jgi:PKD repeat protein
LPAAFTFVVTIPTGGNPVRELRVSWGDGSAQNLGAVSGSQPASHVYENAGSYIVTATVTDVAGISQTVSSPVTVIPIPRPTIIVTPNPQSARVNETINFRIEITAPAGIGIQQTVIDFGDGQTQALGGATVAVVPHEYLSATPATKFVQVTVRDTANQVTIGTTSVSISP